VGKVKRLFVCSSCRRPSAQWAGRCSSCGSWGTVDEHLATPSAAHPAGRSRPTPAVLTLAPEPEERRIQTGLEGADRVLGGGLVPGSAVLIAGAPGIGKSTLLLQLASRLTETGHPCLLASGEESRSQVASRARRLGVSGQAVSFTSGRELADVVAAALAERPAVLIVDSIQTIRDGRSTSAAGGSSQVRACADALISTAKEHDIALLLVGHVTKDGDLAGPRTLEHAVDAVVTFEGEPRSGLRILSGGKNRFGSEGEVAWFEMTSGGLVERDAGPRVGEATAEPGCATAVVLAGRRAFAIEVQALVVPTEGPPKRQVAGLDPRRFHIVAAVTNQAMGSAMSRAELYGASAGGLHLDDPGADLAIAAALASARTGRATPQGVGFVGELSLAGSVRPVAGMESRCAAAASAGLKSLVVPGNSLESPTPPARNGLTGDGRSTVRFIPVAHVREALAWASEDAREDRNAL
jgi:DNA repair protein RadA/Sms